MKLLVAGSRSITPSVPYLRELCRDLYLFPTEIVSGGAPGVDTEAENLARALQVDLHVMPAKWDTEGRSAGMKRNARMAHYADEALVLWDGRSKGAANMIQQMERLGKPCHVVRSDRDEG